MKNNVPKFVLWGNYRVDSPWETSVISRKFDESGCDCSKPAMKINGHKYTHPQSDITVDKLLSLKSVLIAPHCD
jgi:hypothetical protein